MSRNKSEKVLDLLWRSERLLEDVKLEGIPLGDIEEGLVMAALYLRIQAAIAAQDEAVARIGALTAPSTGQLDLFKSDQFGSDI